MSHFGPWIPRSTSPSPHYPPSQPSDDTSLHKQRHPSSQLPQTSWQPAARCRLLAGRRNIRLQQSALLVSMQLGLNVGSPSLPAKPPNWPVIPSSFFPGFRLNLSQWLTKSCWLWSLWWLEWGIWSGTCFVFVDFSPMPDLQWNDCRWTCWVCIS